VRPILVGEVNPRSRDPRLALWPDPPRCAGGRLLAILGVTRAAYFRDFERCNLCSGRWHAGLASLHADALLALLPRRVLVLLGARVAGAFGVDRRPFSVVVGEEHTLVLLPHPSGRCRAWNDPGAVERARDALRLGGVDL
jgi:hypothetical protein